MNLAGLPMKNLWRANHFSTKSFADSLMTEAHAKNREFPGQALDQLDADARILWGARAGRDDDAFGLATGDLFDGDFVVAMHFQGAAKLAQILREVISEGI